MIVSVQAVQDQHHVFEPTPPNLDLIEATWGADHSLAEQAFAAGADPWAVWVQYVQYDDTAGPRLWPAWRISANALNGMPPKYRINTVAASIAERFQECSPDPPWPKNCVLQSDRPGIFLQSAEEDEQSAVVLREKGYEVAVVNTGGRNVFFDVIKPDHRG